MSDIAPGPPDISSFLPEFDGGTADDSNVAGQADGSLADGFLANIPENDRAVVGRYVKDWDANVTRRFQEIHNEYSPYKELGEVENLRQAMELYQMLDTQPEVIYEALKQHFDQPQISGAQQAFPQQAGVQNQQLQQPTPQMDPRLQQALTPLLSPLQEKLDQQEQIIQKMADVIVRGHQSTQEQQEDAALDSYLTDLKETHGNFDESAILLYLYQNPGSTGEQAVAAWQQQMQQYMGNNAPARTPPPVLTGGSVPANPVDVGSLESKDIKNLVANVMAASVNQ